MTPEEKIADLKTERKKLCDDFENMKAGLESQIAILGERCNQLLKDKGNLQDTLDNQTVAYETLKLHDQEEIGMLKSRVAELEQQIEKLKADIEQAIEDADRWKETETFSVLNLIYNDNFEITKGVSN